jgi:hypothetical protein
LQPGQNGGMSVIEDVRQVLQDFISPELRALSVRMDSLEKVVDARHNEIMANFEALKVSLQLNTPA